MKQTQGWISTRCAIVAAGVNRMRRKDNALLLITHYQRLLDYIKPHFVHVLLDGKIAASGGPSWPSP